MPLTNGRCSRTLHMQQVRSKKRISTGQVRDKLQTDDANIKRLVLVIGNQELSVKNMMDASELKGRDNFLNLYSAAFRGEVDKGLFFRGKDPLPFGNAIRTVQETIQYLLNGALPAHVRIARQVQRT